MTTVDWLSHDETLRRMRADGAAASSIAARIPNATRNAVLARAKRLGLPSGRRAPPPRVVPPPRSEQRVSIAVPAAPLSPKLLAAFVAPPGRGLTPLAALPAGACRWPYDGPAETLLCAAAVTDAGRPYCAAHTALARRPAGEAP